MRRRRRVRARVNGTGIRPRLAVSRSLQHIVAQLVDDTTGRTLASASDRTIKSVKGQTKTDRAKLVGTAIAEQAKILKITTVVFDRGGRLYHGRVRALAEGARAGGLKF
jgi:large subunit ribosomal protein L18